MNRLFDLSGKRAIVTGSTRGIGRAIAEAMIEAGAQVIVSSENESDTRAAARALGQTGIACDVADDQELARLASGAVEALGGIDILVCNAGITGRHGPLSTIDMDDYARVMAVNLRSQVLLANLCLPHIAVNEAGSVILIASISALRGNGAIGAYALAKAGVAQLARNLAVEWGPRGVRTNAIAPGFIATDLAKPLLEDPGFMARRMQMTPLRRPGTVEEVAGSAVFLASPAGGFVNGQVLVVDGGTVITDGS